ncbi:MAG TPA: RNA-binding protein [Flavisolibacter sp.]
MNIHISNFSPAVTNEQVRSLFETHGAVASAEVVKDLFTEKSRGFAFVEMPDEQEALAAISALDKTNFEGSTISVKPAVAKEQHKGSYKVGNGAVNAYRFRKN